MQQRQKMLKRQRDLLTKRAQPGLCNGIIQQNQLQQRKTSDWSKFVMDQSLFQPAVVAPVAAGTTGSDEPELAAAVADGPPAAVAQQNRPMTGDSTATVHFDSIPSAPTAVAGAGLRGPSPTPMGGRSLSPTRMQAVGSTPSSNAGRPTPKGAADQNGWDLQVGAPEDRSAMKKEPARGGGRSFWRPFAGRAGGVSIATEEATVVCNIGGVDAFDEDGPLGMQRPVDSRVVTPWQQAAGNGALDGVEDLSVLPGALDESFTVHRAPPAMRRPRPEVVPQHRPVSSFGEDDIFGAVPTMELEN